MFSPRSNFFSSARLIWIILLLIGLIFNENSWMVVGRTWPRMKSYGKIYSKDALFIANVTSRTTAPSPVTTTTTERNSFSEINSSRSLGDYKLLNGNVSSGCNHHQHSNGDREDENSSGWWWTNDTNCRARPFHLRGDVNESVYNQLCPSSNGKFPVPGTCGWYSVCANGEEFTLNQCDTSGKQQFDGTRGNCITCTTNSCMDDLGETENLPILQEILKRAFTSRESTATALTISADNDNNLEPTHLQPNALSQSISSSSSSAGFIPSTLLVPTGSSSSQQLENLCTSSSTHGLYPHPHVCSKYIHCGSSAGTYFIKDCGPGTIFNHDLLVCDWPVNVPQCTLSSNGTYLQTPPFPHDGNRLQKRSALVGNDNVRRPLSKTFLTRRKREAAKAGGVPITAATNSTGEKCDGSEDYISPDPLYCNKYRICSNSRIVSITCGQGTLFNPTSSVCDFADEVDCTSRKADLGTYGCNKGDSYKAPHPEFCNKFVECDDGVLAIKTCPPGTLYDREKATCDHTFRVTCRKPISLEHDIDVNYKHNHLDKKKKKRRSVVSLHRNVRSDKLNLACEYNYIAPHPTICNRFVECEDRRIFIKTCGPGTAFNPLIGKCDWPYNVREPDLRDCTKYRQCVRTHYENRSCRQNQIFDPELGKCVRGTQYQVQQCRVRNTPRTTTTTWRPPFAPPTPS